MKIYIRLLLGIVFTIMMFIPFVRVEARTVGIPKGVATLTNQDENGYQYDIGIDFDTWFLAPEEEGGIPYALIDGWELYEKVNGDNTLVYRADVNNGERDIDQPYSIQIEKGALRTFVVRNFVYDENMNATYSGYSDEVVLDHRTRTTIIMRVHNGKGCYSINGEGLDEYVCGERDHDEIDTDKVGRKSFTVPSNTEVTVKAFPEEGYQLDGWYGFDPAGGKLSTSIILISGDMEYTFTADELVEGDYLTTGPAFIPTITYQVIEGANQTYTIDKSSVARFRIDADYSLFEDGGVVFVDGQELDSSLYTSEEGSTIITLNKEYVDTLSIGEHTLEVLFNDGGTATTVFTVSRESSTNTDTGYEIMPPSTGVSTTTNKDNNLFYFFIMVLSIVTIPLSKKINE